MRRNLQSQNHSLMTWAYVAGPTMQDPLTNQTEIFLFWHRAKLTHNSQTSVCVHFDMVKQAYVFTLKRITLLTNHFKFYF